MGTKTIRGGSMTFDADKEKDIIGYLEGLAGSRDLGVFIANLIRAAFDNDRTAFQNITSTLSAYRTEYFKRLAQEVKEQDRKIDEVYEMCSDLYGLARMNKVMGLESKAENMLSSQFILQRQQNELKRLLGVDNLNTPYVSDKLLNEAEKADKVMGFIMEVYEPMIAETKNTLYQRIEYVTPKPTEVQQVTIEAKQVKAQAEADDEMIDLVEKPLPKKEIVVNAPTGARADAAKRMLQGI